MTCTVVRSQIPSSWAPFLCLSILLFSGIFSPLTAQQQQHGPFLYTSNGASITITGYVGDSVSISIPASIDGLPVWYIGNSAFANHSTLQNVTIPEGVTTIGSSAFSGSLQLSQVNLPSSLKTIGHYAFLLCRSLPSITIPDGVTSMGSAIFNECRQLTRVVLPNSLTEIPNAAFVGCTSLIDIIIPDHVSDIGFSAFMRCTSLTHIFLPKNIRDFSPGTFENCQNLLSIEVAEQNARFRSVDGVVFSKDMASLLQYPGGKTGPYSIPTGVTTIDLDAFTKSAKLTRVTIPDSVTTIKQAFFGCPALEEVYIPASVTTLTPWSFSNCQNLRAIDVAESNPAFKSVDGILFSKDMATLVQYPGGKTGGYAIPDTTISIAPGAFLNCKGLAHITISNSITSLDEQAFYGCSALAHASIPASVTTIISGAFAYCSSLLSIEVAEDNPAFRSIEGVLFSKDMDTLVQYPGGKTGGYAISDNVTEIGEAAFYGCSGLSSVIIPPSIEAISHLAFHDCFNLRSAFFTTTDAASLSIGNTAFNNPAQGFAFYFREDSTSYIQPEFSPRLPTVTISNRQPVSDELRIISISRLGQSLASLTIAGGREGWIYDIQGTADLADNTWQSLQTIGPLAASGTIEAADYWGRPPSTRFYRVVGRAPAQD